MASILNLPQHPQFLVGGGKMADAILAKDWSTTPLGAFAQWPQSLRTAVSLCLASNFPISIAWGPAHVQIYNDGYWPICGAKHPGSMGQDFKECWQSAWLQIGAAFERAKAGETSFLENQRMFLDRNGYIEETFFTFSFSPIRDESGEVGGLFHPVIETTNRMLAERRTRALRDLAAQTSKAKTQEDVCRLAAEALADDAFDVPFALIYLLDETGTQARLAGHAGIDPGTSASPAIVDMQAPNCCWPFSHMTHSGGPILVGHLETHLPAPCGPYPESPKQAFVSHFFKPGKGTPTAVLIVGVSPRLALDEAYRAFFESISGNLSAALSNAAAQEDERRRAEALAQLDHAKTAFFSNVSHEFRTPLTLILGPLEEMLSRAGSGAFIPAGQEELQLIHRNANRLLKLVNALLDFSRLEAGRVKANYESLDLASVTRDIASVFRSAVERVGISFVIDCPPLPEPVFVDREMWEKIVLNLLSNALKFTMSGEIRLKLSHSETGPTLAVLDTGIGIPSAEIAHIFERFHRVEGAKGRTHEGTGIGLAMVQELVQLHGATIHLDSCEGQGSEFTIRLRYGSTHLPEKQICMPALGRPEGHAAALFLEEAIRWSPAQKAAPELTNESAVGPALSSNTGSAAAARPKVLIADDNDDMRDYVRRLLDERFAVEAVANGEEALQSVAAQLPNLVLTDVMMPGLDGFGLLRELRQNPRTATLPIILLSARAGEESRVEGLAAGADDYLVKPFGARELLARVDSNIALARLRKEVADKEEAYRIELHTSTALRESEQRLRDLNTALDLSQVCIRNLDGTITFWCAGNARLYGWSLDQARGCKTHDLLQTVFPKPLHEIEAELMRRRSWEGELLQRTKAGDQLCVASSWVLQTTQDGSPVAVIEVNNNITDRKRADDVSRHLASIVEYSDDAIISNDTNGIVTSWNSAAQRLFGYTADQMVGRSILTLIPYELLGEETVIRQRLANGDRISHFETVRLAKSGRRIDVSLAVSPIYNGVGKMIGASKVIRDVSQKKALELAFQESEKERHLAIEAGEVGLWSVDIDTLKVHWTERAKAIFGLNPQTPTPSYKAVFQLIHPEDTEQVERCFQSSIVDGKDFAIDFRVMDNKGKIRWVHSKWRPFIASNGKVTQVYGTMVDLTSRKQTEEALKRTNSQLQQSAYAAAHDLQEPLRNVALSVGMARLQAREVLDSETEAMLGVAVNSARKMEAMVKDLLAYSRVLHDDVGNWPVSDGNEVLRSALENLASEISTSGAGISHDRLPSVTMERAHLLQVFQNLLSNAIKYRTLETPRIHVGAVPRNNYWEISVSDNGIGIAPEFHQRVFGVFKRLREKDVEGSGLGLALCKRIVENYGGEIKINSEGTQGSTFLFTVPAAKKRGHVA
jgi:PAS domain S-box-containing protein